MDQKIKWGILGCGKIAAKFAHDLKLSQTSLLMGCASRDLEKARTFASEYEINHFYGTYEDLASSTEIDVIYIATPHNFHRSHTLLCLNHYKAVLCEKPLAVNANEVKEMHEVAIKNKVFLMEALWTGLLPVMTRVSTLIENGQIGTIRHIKADFGFISPFNPNSRLFSAQLAGGSILDIGIYPIFMALFLLGKPKSIKASATIGESGVDLDCAILLTYENGATASLYSSLLTNSPTTCEIWGTEGSILIPTRFHEQDHFFVGEDATNMVRYDIGKIGYGYYHEIEHVNALLIGKATQSPILPHDFSLNLMEIMDEVRKQIGLSYPMELN